MRRWLATVTIFAVCSAIVRADVTVVQTTTMEGGMAAMAAGDAPPKITTRVKGTKARVDMEIPGVNASSITDLAAKQVIVLKHDAKTAQVADEAAPAPPAASSITLDTAATPTGKSQVIDGLKCDEFTFTATMALGEVMGAQMPPEAAEMMKGLSLAMKGSTWVAKDAPGAAEYVAFQKGLAKSDLASTATKVSGVKIPGLDKMMKAIGSLDGVAYMTVMDVTIEGSGQIADMMRQMGAMKITMKVTAINADPVGDDLFKVPEGYTVIK